MHIRDLCVPRGPHTLLDQIFAKDVQKATMQTIQAHQLLQYADLVQLELSEPLQQQLLFLSVCHVPLELEQVLALHNAPIVLLGHILQLLVFVSFVDSDITMEAHL